MTETVIHSENGAIDSTAVELYQPPAPPALFGTTDPVEVVDKAAAVADALAAVIRAKKLFAHIQGRDHVLVEGWQLLGVMLGVTAVCVETVEIADGYKATVEARTADGRVIGRADAVCTKTEKRGPWKMADDYARLSMAQTRATSKALKGPLGFVVSLAGYATTPAEEMTFAEPEAAPAGVPVVTADPPKATEQLASAAQRRLINAKAGEHNLTPLELLNSLRVAAGSEPLAGLTDEQATAAAKRILDRLPARLVDVALEVIATEPPDAETVGLDTDDIPF